MSDNKTVYNLSISSQSGDGENGVSSNTNITTYNPDDIKRLLDLAGVSQSTTDLANAEKVQVNEPVAQPVNVEMQPEGFVDDCSVEMDVDGFAPGSEDECLEVEVEEATLYDLRRGTQPVTEEDEDLEEGEVVPGPWVGRRSEPDDAEIMEWYHEFSNPDAKGQDHYQVMSKVVKRAMRRYGLNDVDATKMVSQAIRNSKQSVAEDADDFDYGVRDYYRNDDSTSYDIATSDFKSRADLKIRRHGAGDNPLYNQLREQYEAFLNESYKKAPSDEEYEICECCGMPIEECMMQESGGAEFDSTVVGEDVSEPVVVYNAGDKVITPEGSGKVVLVSHRLKNTVWVELDDSDEVKKFDVESLSSDADSEEVDEATLYDLRNQKKNSSPVTPVSEDVFDGHQFEPQDPYEVHNSLCMDDDNMCDDCGHSPCVCDGKEHLNEFYIDFICPQCKELKDDCVCPMSYADDEIGMEEDMMTEYDHDGNEGNVMVHGPWHDDDEYEVDESFNEPDEILNSAGKATLHRISHSYPELISHYGSDKVINAIDAVTFDLGDLEEIGSSDVSIWAKQVIRDLQAGNDRVEETAPKGWEGTVKAMKKHKEIDNPWALANYMKNKGYHSHVKENNMRYKELVEDACPECRKSPCECDDVLEEKKWIKTHPSRKGMFKGKDLSDLESQKTTLKKKDAAKRERGEKVPQKDRTKMSQLNFAIRAKQGHGFKNESLELDEKWAGKHDIKKLDKYGKEQMSMAEIDKKIAALHKKEDHTAADTKELKRLQFAKRARKGWK